MQKSTTSSNPFRKTQQQASEDEDKSSALPESIFDISVTLPIDDDHLQDDRSSQGSRQVGTTSKSVQIVSPPPELSVSDPAVRERKPTPLPSTCPSEDETESLSSVSSQSSVKDPFDAAQHEPEGHDPRERGYLASQSAHHVTLDESPLNDGHPNETSTTNELVTGKPKLREARDPPRSFKPLAASSSSPSKAAPTRGSMDVDAFTRLLLTGNSGPSSQKATLGASGQPGAPTGVFGDSSSNTDTSSISRQSIFEPAIERQHDTPRSSHEINRSDDENQRLRIEGSSAERQKPIPPKPRHGRSIPNASDNDPISARPPSYRHSMPPFSTATPSSPTDLNKPLPSTPDNLTPVATSTSTPSRKRPPTPPMGRRHSRIGRPPSIAEGSEQDETASFTSSIAELSRSSSLKAPPPPPVRRPGISRSALSGSAEFSSNPSTPSSMVENIDDPMDRLQGKPIKPAPPPSRAASIAKRPPKPSTYGTTAVSASPPSSSMAPPPPPRRRRGSSKSSIDPIDRSEEGRRSSRVLSEPLPTNEAYGSSAQAAEILEETTALQREIDELRGKVARDL